MRYSPERVIRDIEFKSVAAVGIAELMRMAGQVWRLQAISMGTDFNAIHPAANFILDYTGDFALGFMFTFGIKETIPRVSEQIKLRAATGIVLVGGILAETLAIPGAHIEDLPALVAGIGAYRGLHWGLNRLLQPKRIP